VSTSHASKANEGKHTLGPFNVASDKRLALSKEELSKLFSYSVSWSGKIPEEAGETDGTYT
jgi:hypothetical protein